MKVDSVQGGTPHSVPAAPPVSRMACGSTLRELKRMIGRIVNSLVVLFLISGILLTAGCRGCGWGGFFEPQDREKTEEEKKKEEQKKPDFITRTPVLQPGYFPPKYDPEREKERAKMPADVRAAMEEQTNSAIRYNRHKLGHWVEANISVIANNFNADGRMGVVAVTPAGNRVAIPSTSYFAVTERPIALTKGEWKNLEVSLFLPRRDQNVVTALVDYQIDRGSGAVPYVGLTQGTTLMKPSQYHIVLLSERPDTYNFFKLTDSVQLRGQHFSDDQLKQFYHLIPTLSDEPIPLPRQSLYWTTIAYLIWDDYDPDKLSRDQQNALLDWIHFGGQLILSGPDCLSKLQNSFLASYLPAQFDGSTNLTERDFEELNGEWTVPLPRGRAKGDAQAIRISQDVPLLGVRFTPHEDADYLAGTGELLIERQVGRGRIVMTSFSLNSPAIRKWSSFQSLVNGALLRRPARKFTGRMNEVFLKWAEDNTSTHDPLIGSTLRYLARDLPAGGTSLEPTYNFSTDLQLERNWQGWIRESENEARGGNRNLSSDRFYGGYNDTRQSGVAGWNDDSGISQAARNTLQEAAGIVPPSSRFVLKMLAIYLTVLVPLNWLVFWLMGRVEWAWIAAPFIAIAGAVMVVRMASLDIGFVRSNTQVGTIEMFADYPRAHVAEYSALYTSLSTRYDIELDNSSAQSLPFATASESEGRNRTGPIKGVTLKRGVASRLEGFPIQSNSTGLLHTEFMLDMEGTMDATYADNGIPLTINNGTSVSIQNSGIVRRDREGQLWLAWIGDLPAGVTADLKFEALSDDDYTAPWRKIGLFYSTQRRAREIWQSKFDRQLEAELEEIAELDEVAENWDRVASLFQAVQNRETKKITRDNFERVLGSVNVSTGVSIGRLLDVLPTLQLSPGEVRLLGSTDQRLGRTRFSPEATRNDRQTLVIAHLRRPGLPPAKRDQNSAAEFLPVSTLDWEREETADEED